MVGTFRLLPQTDARRAMFGWSHGVPGSVAPAHRMVPFWYVSLVVWRSWSEDGRIADVLLRLHGPQPKSYLYASSQPIELIGMALAPEVAALVAGIDNREGACQLIDWKDPRFDAALALAENGAPPEAIADAMARPIRKALAERSPSRIDDAIAIMRRMHGTAPIRSIRERMTMSERQFRAQFKDAVGISAKAYSKLLRINGLIGESDRSEQPAWTDLAQKYRYFDQAHMINEIKNLTGQTPVALDRERRAELTSP